MFKMKNFVFLAIVLGIFVWQKYNVSLSDLLGFGNDIVPASTPLGRFVDQSQKGILADEFKSLRKRMEPWEAIANDSSRSYEERMAALKEMQKIEREGQRKSGVTSTKKAVEGFFSEQEVPKETIEKVKQLSTLEWKAFEKGYEEPQLFAAPITDIDPTPDGSRVHLIIRYDHEDGYLEGWLKNRSFTGIWRQSNDLEGRFNLTFNSDFSTGTGYRVVGSNPETAPHRFLKISNQ